MQDIIRIAESLYLQLRRHLFILTTKQLKLLQEEINFHLRERESKNE
jgi:hypothetical protein